MEDFPTRANQILNMKNFHSVRKLMEKWNLPTGGINSLNDGIECLMKHWYLNYCEEKDKMTLTNFLRDAILQNNKRHEEMREKYDQCFNFYSKLPMQHRLDLDEVFQNLNYMIEKGKQDLETAECTILVAGEAGAGKSSFINNLLGEPILPTANVPCTATICELKACQDGNKSAVLTYKPTENGKRRNPRYIDLQSETGLTELEECIKESNEYFGESPYDKIEIYWPFSCLQNGIVIVDAPDIVNGQRMSMFMEQYLSKPFSLIYLVNISAGGIQKERLEDFLRTLINSSKDDFSPSSIMFVCNKWDTVPDSDKEIVKNNTFDMIIEIFPGVRKDQIHCISIQQKMSAPEYCSLIKGKDNILDGITKLFHSSFRNKLDVHYRWLSQVFKRALYSLKVAKAMDVRGIEKNREMISDFQRQTERLDIDARHSVADLQKGVTFEVEFLYKKISTMLRDQNFVRKLAIWDTDQCPKPNDCRRTAHEASERIASRIAFEVGLWERNNDITTHIKENIVKKFQSDFELLEDKITRIEGGLLEGDAKDITDLLYSMKKEFPILFENAENDVFADSIQKLGGSIGSAGRFDFSLKRIEELFSDYKKDTAQQKMLEATKIVISDILSGQSLRKNLEAFLDRFIRGIDNVAIMIPEFLKADNQLINTLQTQMESEEDEMKDVYVKLIQHCDENQFRLNLFFMNQIQEMDFRMRDLDCKKEDLIGTGCFANLYKAKLRKGNNVIPVALRVYSISFNRFSYDARDILLEHRVLREMKHKNIVRYYGSVRNKEEDKRGRRDFGGDVFMIAELCEGTLDKLIFDHESFSLPPYENPAHLNISDKQIASMREMAGYVIQICRGLEYLHSKNLVYRVLKSTNVLISNSVLKLHGFTKRILKNPGRRYGTVPFLAYIAPEIACYPGIYNQKADVYSLAMVIWEMWYGIHATEHIESQFHPSFSCPFDLELYIRVRNGTRPSFSEKEKPPEDWKAIIQQCWEHEPTKRPEIIHVINFFDDFLINTK